MHEDQIFDLGEALTELSEEAHVTAIEKGFYDDVPYRRESLPPSEDWRPAKLALVHSEVSEALEALRNDDAENYQEELADIIIRVIDLAKFDGIDIGAAVAAKMIVNDARPHKHGKKF